MLKKWENKNNIDKVNNILSNKNLYYKSFKIPKKNGSYRLIHQPIDDLNTLTKFLLKSLKTKIPEKIYDVCSYGFTKDKSIIQNSKLHINKNFVINIDLKNYFSSIDKDKVKSKLIKFYKLTDKEADFYSDILTYKDTLPQGACTSPFISNLVTFDLDRAIDRICKNNNITYSRYVDDLTFSTDDNIYPSKPLNQIRFLIKNYGYKINKSKFRVYQSNKRQLVTGLVVNQKVNIKKEDYKLIRAIIYNWNKNGYDHAEKFFQLKFHKKNLLEHVEGKLNFFKLVLGEDNPKYIQLFKEFSSLKKDKLQYLNCNKKISFKIFSCIDEKKEILIIIVDERGKVFSKNSIKNINIYHEYESFNIIEFLRQKFKFKEFSVNEILTNQIESINFNEENNWIIPYVNKLKTKSLTNKPRTSNKNYNVDKIILGDELINRCEINIYEDIVQVKIWLTEQESYDAFMKGGAINEIELLINLRNKLFPNLESNMLMFYDEKKFNIFWEQKNYILDGWFNSTFFYINDDLDSILNKIKSNFKNNIENQIDSNLSSNFSAILNYSNYYSDGPMDFGIDGPEIDNQKLYISIYHFLQYIGEDPHNYDTYSLGNYLTKKSLDYKTCKYMCQSFNINKFNFELLIIEKNNFLSFKKIKNILHTTKPKYNTNSYLNSFKPCPQCGEMHNAAFNRCAVCNDFSASNDPDWF